MSYDLYFWRQHESCTLSPEEVLEAVDTNGTVPGIEPFPIELFLDGFQREFPHAEKNITKDPEAPYQIFWSDPGCSASLEVQRYPFEPPL